MNTELFNRYLEENPFESISDVVLGLAETDTDLGDTPGDKIKCGQDSQYLKYKPDSCQAGNRPAVQNGDCPNHSWQDRVLCI